MTLEQLNMIIPISAAIGTILSIWALFLRFSDKLDKKFDRIDERFNKIDEKFENLEQKIDIRFQKVDELFNEIQFDIRDLAERVSFLEASSIYTMPLEPAQPNSRSEAAKEMWKRRRQRKLMHNEEK